MTASTADQSPPAGYRPPLRARPPRCPSCDAYRPGPDPRRPSHLSSCGEERSPLHGRLLGGLDPLEDCCGLHRPRRGEG